MPTIRFIGRVLPPRMRLTLKDLPTVNWKDNELGLVIDATITVDDSVVTVVCESNRYSTHDDFTQVYRRAFDMARAAVDCFAYANGFGLTVVLESMVPPNGVRHDILTEEKRLPKMVTAFNTSDGALFSQAFGIILSDPLAFMALNDLIAAVSLDHIGAINCARTVESLRNSLAPDVKRKTAWEFMQQQLDISEGYLSLITEESSGPRHGHRIGGTQTNYTESIDRAWTVMNRFLEFRKRENQQLPLPEFPLL